MTRESSVYGSLRWATNCSAVSSYLGVAFSRDNFTESL
jgi:hypothetical protein